MKTILILFSMVSLAWLAGMSGIWYAFAIALFIVSFLFSISTGRAFLLGALAMTILWALVFMLTPGFTSTTFSQTMAQVFSLKSPVAFLSVHLFVGSLLGGLSSATGAAFRGLFQKRVTG